jgi:MoxR-like ATPase
MAHPRAMMSSEGFASQFASIVDSVERVIRGKKDVVELALTCLLAEGHLLIEDVPGVGKTTLARSLSATIGGRLQRIQFTPDLLPSDVVGVSIFHPATGAFQFHPGPVFANIVLGDEINRASPKTQSALLEVMEERRVTVDGHAYPVPRPFMVIATQNPVEMGGTYPLPEAQLDRFLMRLGIGYPDHTAEVSVLVHTRRDSLVDTLDWAMSSPADIAAMVEYASVTRMAPPLLDYVVNLVAATRCAADVRLGGSPRASVALMRAGRVRAAAQGRGYVVPADIKSLAVPVLAHRLVLTPEAQLRGRTSVDVIQDVVSTVAVPAPVPAQG